MDGSQAVELKAPNSANSVFMPRVNLVRETHRRRLLMLDQANPVR